jgi:hypothetical protein
LVCFTPPSTAEQTASWLDAVTVLGYAKLAASSPNRGFNPFTEVEACSIPLWVETKPQSPQIKIPQQFSGK